MALTAGAADAEVCSNLQQQYIAAGSSAGVARVTSATDVAAMNNQLRAAQAAALSNHCNGGILSIFGPAPSPACPQINLTVSQLTTQIRQASGNSGGLFSSGLFALAGPKSVQDQIYDQLVANGCSIPESGVGGYKTLCVRTCDGYYFPLGYGETSASFASDAQSCQTMYGAGGQAQLFVMPSDGDVAGATPVNGGVPYGSQAYAFAYRSSFNASCVGQLQSGTAALSARFTPVQAASVVAALPPVPQTRPLRFEDPETQANALGDLVPGPMAVAAVRQAAPPGSIRVVGAGYYNAILDQQAAAAAKAATPVPPVVPPVANP